MRVATGFSMIAALSVSTVSAVATNSSATKLPLLSDGILDFGVAQEAYDKARSFVDSLTNEQKASIIVGGGFDDGNVSWTPLVSKNGVSGINMAFFVSGFPMMNAATMTWNRDLVEAQFKATGEEFYDSGYNLIYGPVASPLGRDPYGGRLPEGFSPDPYLSGILMGKQVSGFNSAGVVTEGRHYLLNEQETNRMGGGYSANADEKTIQEVYLWPFADAVKSGMMAVMCAMNKVNGVLSCENSELLNQYLKTDLGFPGLVSPDVGSQVTSYDSANAGLDLGSSQLWSQQVIIDGIANGNLSQGRLDDMAVRNVVGYYFAGLDDGKIPSTAAADEWRDVRRNHSAIIKKVANEAIILLKNDKSENRGLPLNSPRTISLFGAHAGPCMAGPNQQFSVAGTPADTYPGHLATGGGAGQASFTYLVTPFEPLALRAAAEGSMIWWIMNNTYDPGSFSGIPGGGNDGFPGGGGNGSFPSFPGGGGGGNGSFPGAPGGGDGGGNGTIPGFPGGGGGGGGGGFPGFGGGTGSTPSFETYSTNSEVCIVFINSMSGEGSDRQELRNVEQDLMVNTVADNCNNTVVVGNFAGPRILDSWIEHPNISAVLYSGLLGQTSGQAIADVLHGDVNPSGKLTHTIAKNESDYPSPTCLTTECDFEEGVFIDYRYFDSQNISVRYPFGHGLSYTTFTYSDISAVVTNQSALESKYPTGQLTLGGIADLFDEVITVQVSIENSGGVDGAEVAQLYITFPEEAEEPTRILRGFEKANISAGGKVTVEFSLRRRDISYWDATVRQWAIAKGEYILAVGSSLHDIRETTTLSI